MRKKEKAALSRNDFGSRLVRLASDMPTSASADNPFNKFGAARLEMSLGGKSPKADEEARADLKKVMRLFPQGVTVVTARAEGGPKGITVSSFTSVSLEPPLVLVSLARGSGLHEFFQKSSSFAVNFLAEDQKSVSDLFAGRTEAKDRFEGVKFREGRTGCPIIDGVRAVIECRRWRVYEGGDHSLILGLVVGASAMSNGRPLVYYNQQYTTTERSEQPAPPSDIVW
jgi:flavin reductase (DIM6/NTAB) family NADH-FMN oxidoreductase RutF